MNCIAIDDEPLALNVIQDFCQRIDYINLVARCTNPVEAVRILNSNDIDLIFLDIQMPNITGLEFIKTLVNPPLVILTTAYTEHALQGYEINALDYLVKPIPFERFFRAVNKAYELINLKKGKPAVPVVHAPVEASVNYIMVKVEYNLVKVNLDDIIYIEGLKDYIKIYTVNGPKALLTKSTMKNIEEKLPEDRFVRVHKSFIVSVSKINMVENNRILFGEKRIPVGNQYKQHFYEILNRNKI